LAVYLFFIFKNKVLYNYCALFLRGVLNIAVITNYQIWK